MVNTSEHRSSEERVLDPRSVGLVVAATAVAVLYLAIAAGITTIVGALSCAEVDEAVSGCRAADVIGTVAFPLAPLLVGIAGVITARRGSWHWLGGATLGATAAVAAPWIVWLT